MVDTDTGRTSSIPVIMITYPASKDSIWIDINIKNELLAKLVKHSLMTQVPINVPFGDYLADAKCSKCHPSNVKVKSTGKILRNLVYCINKVRNRNSKIFIELLVGCRSAKSI